MTRLAAPVACAFLLAGAVCAQADSPSVDADAILCGGPDCTGIIKRGAPITAATAALSRLYMVALEDEGSWGIEDLKYGTVYTLSDRNGRIMKLCVNERGRIEGAAVDSPRVVFAREARVGMTARDIARLGAVDCTPGVEQFYSYLLCNVVGTHVTAIFKPAARSDGEDPAKLADLAPDEPVALVTWGNPICGAAN